MDIPKLAYSAGIFDGEGCVRIGRNDKKNGHIATPHFYLQAFIRNQNLQVLQMLQAEFHGSLHHSASCYTWSLSSLQAAAFLEAIKPYAIIKLPEIEVALEFQRLQNENSGSRCRKTDGQIQEREVLRQKLSALKQVDKEEFKWVITESEPIQIN